MLNAEVVLQPKFDTGFTGITAHILDRLSPYAVFASKRMTTQTANAYLAYMDFILGDLVQQHEHTEALGTFDMILRIDSLSRRLPKREYGVKDTFNGSMRADIEARRFALEHVFDLAISYRRFEGCVPFSHDEETLRRHRNQVITSHLKSLSENF